MGGSEGVDNGEGAEGLHAGSTPGNSSIKKGRDLPAISDECL